MYEPDKGITFRDAVKQLQDDIKWANFKDHESPTYKTMNFNDISITVSMDSNVDDLAIIYELKRKIKQHNIS